MLLRTIQTNKPPILGPTNSALPITQSPWYYYLNLPIFIGSSMSPYTTLVTLTSLFLISFAIAYWTYHHDSKAIVNLTAFIILLSLHPQLLEQHRYPWNPTYTVPMLILGFLSVFHRRFVEQKKWQWLFAFSSVAAIGFSYSVVPVVLLAIGYSVYRLRKRAIELVIPGILSVLIIFGPLLFFEVRHGFLFSKSLLATKPATSQMMPVTDKVVDLFSYILGTGRRDYQMILVVSLVLVVSGISTIKKSSQTFRERVHIHSLFLLILGFILTCTTPFPVLVHYIFGVVILLLIAVATLRPIFFLFLFIFLIWRWTPFTVHELYVRTPRRTVSQLDACAKQVCASQTEPLYVSLQAWHGYHFAPDHLFFMNKNGCVARDITQDPGFAKTMAVVVDQSSYEHTKTAYNELTLFGTASVSATYRCEGNIQVVLLKKE